MINILDCKFVYLDTLDVDNEASTDLTEKIKNLIKTENGTVNLIIDMTDVSNISSSGIGVLISISNRISKSNGILKIINLRPKILDILKMTKLDQVFDLSLKI